MGYANYWRWKTPIADADKFAEWSSDVHYLLDELSTPDRELPLSAYRGIPLFPTALTSAVPLAEVNR